MDRRTSNVGALYKCWGSIQLCFSLLHFCVVVLISKDPFFLTCDSRNQEL
jgi:hypothetical protein